MKNGANSTYLKWKTDIVDASPVKEQANQALQLLEGLLNPISSDRLTAEAALALVLQLA